MEEHFAFHFPKMSSFQLVSFPIERALLHNESLVMSGFELVTRGLCKEQLPAPGNRSNERRYREKDLATTEEKKVGTGEKREGDEKSRGREK
ncbi:hypothetical protein TNCV_6621 [Trichonephila clavipes]|nr:hypothetical protein TNCV_6621 [Trichonephila clavipes]